MTALFNQIVEQEYIPQSFQHGLIIPIPKSSDKDPSDPSNYRGITLLSLIAKTFEKVILLRLQAAGIPDQIHPLQGGFKPGVSCIHTAFIFQEAIQHLREQKQKAYVALLDVQKAFDTVWHNGLFYKLYQYGIQDNTWRILRKWYDSSSCTVLWDGEQSRPFNINQGVKQGAILSPLLYNLFVNELLVTLEQSGLGVKIGSVYCGAPMYADDLALIASSADELQAMLDIVSQYATKWRYCINPLKSKVLLFGSNRLPTTTWTIKGQKVEAVKEHLHLGILRSTASSTSSRRDLTEKFLDPFRVFLSDALRRVLVPSLDAPLLLTSSQLKSSPSCSQ